MNNEFLIFYYKSFLKKTNDMYNKIENARATKEYKLYSRICFLFTLVDKLYSKQIYRN